MTFIVMTASMMLITSCNLGNKPDADAENTDSLSANTDTPTASDDPAMVADGVNVAPEDQWTEEAVTRQLKKIYAEVSKTYASSGEGMENNTDLDGMFCTKDFNELQRQIRVINAKKKADDRRFENEQIRWTYGMDVPVTPQNIKVELLTGNMAEATFELHSGEQWMYTKLTFDWEDNQWKIRSWSEVGDDNNDLFDEMSKYVEANS
ncbi:MAG: hypothetical protein IKP41_05765 [Bacteroidaceae bacterium]|nr:hypothetical protein [Bacteroidaceae bacterium]